jgi:hypothetical protein
MNAARQTLETVGFLRGGRIGGFLDGKTSFWLTKRQHEVPMIGEDGQPRRVAQWLIELEAPVDLTRLLRIEGDETRLIEGERGAAVLNGATPALDDPATHADAAVPAVSAATEATGQEDRAASPTPTNPSASRKNRLQRDLSAQHLCHMGADSAICTVQSPPHSPAAAL